MSTESKDTPPSTAGAPGPGEASAEASGGQTSGGQTSGGQTSGGQTSGGRTATEQAPSAKVPGTEVAGPTEVSAAAPSTTEASGPKLDKSAPAGGAPLASGPPVAAEPAAGGSSTGGSSTGGSSTGGSPAGGSSTGGSATGAPDAGWGRRGGNNDLFGAEDLGLDPPPPAEGGRRATPVRAVMVGIGLVVLALLWYWSSVHHDRFYLSLDGDRVTVRRGLYFPIGTSTFAPTAGYSSFTLPSGLAPETNGPMSHEELDRVLRTLYVRIARLQLKDLDQGSPDKAEDMLRRALKLSFSSAEDEVEVIELRGDVAFRRGLKEVRGIQERFDEALLQFRNAARQGGSEYTGADKWVESITRLRDEFRQLAIASNLDPDKILSSPVPLAPAGFLGGHTLTPPAPAKGTPAKPTDAPRAPATQPGTP